MSSFNRTKLREIRKNKKLTQVELAQKAGIGVASLIRYESGEREPNLDMIIKLSNTLNISPTLLGIKPNSFLYDTPEGVESEGMTVEEAQAFLNESELLEAFNQLNAEGQKVAVERVEELADIPKYKK